MNKLEAMLELEKRGKLPPQYQDMLKELRKMGKLTDPYAHPISGSPEEKTDKAMRDIYKPPIESKVTYPFESVFNGVDDKSKLSAEGAYDYTAKALADTYNPPEVISSERKKISDEDKKLNNIIPNKPIGEIKSLNPHVAELERRISPPEFEKEYPTETTTTNNVLTTNIYKGAQNANAQLYLDAANALTTLFDIQDNIFKVSEPDNKTKTDRKSLEIIRNKLVKLSEDNRPKKLDEKFFPTLIRATTEAAAGLAKIGVMSNFSNPTAALTILGVVDKAGKSMTEKVKGGLEGYMLGEIFKGLAPLSRNSRILSTATIFGGEAALQGASTKDVMVNTIVGGALSYPGAVEGTTIMNEIRNRGIEHLINRQLKYKNRIVNPNAQIGGMATEKDGTVSISGGLTREEAITGLARGDKSVLPDIRKFVDIFGIEKMQDEIYNHAIGIAAKNKTMKEFRQIEVELKKILQMPIDHLAEEHIPGTAYGKTETNASGQDFGMGGSQEEINRGKTHKYFIVNARNPKTRYEVKDAATKPRPGFVLVDKDLTKGIETVIERGKGTDFYEHPIEPLGRKKEPPKTSPNSPQSPTTKGNNIPDSPTWGDEPIRVSSIMERLRGHFEGLTKRIGRYSVDAVGIFNPFSETIRLKIDNDFRTYSHEVGHYLNKILFGGKLGQLPIENFKPFEDELMPIATTPLHNSYSAKLQEGFAEFISSYLTNDVHAKQIAPKFYDWFDNTLRRDYPEMHDLFGEISMTYQMYLNQSASFKVYSKIDFGNKGSIFSGIKPDSVQQLYYMAVDNLNPFRLLAEDIEKHKDLPFLENAYNMARLNGGVNGVVETFLFKNPVSYTTGEFRKEIKGFSEVLQPVVNDLPKFTTYLVSKRIVEQAGKIHKTSGKQYQFPVTKEIAQRSIKELENTKFIEAAEGIRKFNDSLIDYLIESEVISQKSGMQIKFALQNYVPFYRVMDDWSGHASGTGKGLDKLFNPVKRQSAYSGRDIINPLESIIKNAFTFIHLAEKQRILRTLVDSVKSTEGFGKYVDSVSVPVKPIIIADTELEKIISKYGKWTETVTYKESLKEFINTVGGENIKSAPMDKLESIVKEALTSRGFNENEANVYINKLKGAKTIGDRTEIIEKIIEKSTIATTIKSFGFEPPQFIADIFRQFDPRWPNVIKVFKDGKPELYEVDPEIYRVISAQDKEATNILIRFLNKPAKLLRLGATTLSPEFGIRNPIRDQWMAFIQSKYGFVPFYHLAKGLFHVIKADEVYWDWKKAGGEHAMMASMDRKFLQSTFDNVIRGKELSSPYAVKTKMIKHPLELIALFSELGEKGTRVGEYENVRNKLRAQSPTMSEKEINARAAFESREVTLDYYRMGAKGQAVNSIVAFWNARLQGFDKVIRTFHDNPVGATAKTIAAITIPELLLYWSQYDDPRYQELPEWEKALFWNIISGPKVTREEWDKMTIQQRQELMSKTTIWRIPGPFELKVLFGAFPISILEYYRTKDPQVFKSFMFNLATSIAPGSFRGLPLPNAVIPPLEIYSNWDEFLDKPIVPKYTEGIEPRYQTTGYSSELSKRIGNALNRSPEKIDHLIKGYTGGFGGLSLRAIDKIFEVAGMTDIKPEARKLHIAGHTVPFVNEDWVGFRGFVSRFPTSSAQSLKRFYKEYDRLSIINKTYSFKNKQDDGSADEYYTKHSKEIESYPAMEKTKEFFTKYQQMVRKTYSDNTLNPKEKRIATDEIYLELVENADRALKNLHEDLNY